MVTFRPQRTKSRRSASGLGECSFRVKRNRSALLLAHSGSAVALLIPP